MLFGAALRAAYADLVSAGSHPLEGEAVTERKKGKKKKSGSCWLTGAARGFPHPSCPSWCGSEYGDESHHRQEIVYAVIIS